MPAALFTAFLAGLARGFSGFGSGLIYMPIASAALGPRVAVASLLIFDFIVAGLPMLRRVRDIELKGMLPVAAGISLFTPVGGWIAAHGDPTVIRWCISAIVFLAILLLTTGVKWHGRETLPVTLAVGALSGTFGGMAALSGIVVVIYWLARDLDPAILRRNMFTLLLLTAVVQAVTFALNGLLTEQVFAISALMLLPYVAGTFIGSMVFPLASPRTFRKIVYGMILCSGIVGLPLFDPWLGR
ncbi:MAG: sulfite exporter TauE/SafE family protein [Rhizobiaceae bacterium]|nr:sulfite exporter TauE/SafE family protein [Rhizobiaceae bacterium]